MSPRLFDRRGAALLLSILVGALVLRAIGVLWGLPDAAHPDYSYHPDETLHILWARMLAEGQLVPKQFMYGGTLYSTVLNAYYAYGRFLSGTYAVSALGGTILFGRLCNIAWSLLTIALVADIGRRLRGPAAGLIAALCCAVAPAALFLTHSVRPDVLATLLATLCVHLSVCLMQAEPRRTPRYYAAIGVVLGAMLALRFPLGAFAIAPVAASVLRARPRTVREWIGAVFQRWLWAAAAISVVAYAAFSPHTLLYPDTFVLGMKVQWNYQSTAFPDAIDRGPGVYQYGVLMLREGLGWPLYLLALGGVAWSLVRREAGQLLLVASVLPYFVLTSMATWVVVRYVLPMLPMLCVLAAIALVDLAQRARALRVGVAAVFGAAVAWTLLADSALLRAESSTDSRDLAAAWLREHVSAGAIVTRIQGYRGDVSYVPVVAPPLVARDLALTADADPLGLANDSAAVWLVVGESIYRNAERLGDRHPDVHTRALMALLAPNGPYRLAQTFAVPVRAFGIDFDAWFTSQDFRIIRPELRVYRRVDAL